MASSNRVAIVLPSGSAAIKASTGAHGLPITLITTRGSPERGGYSKSSR